MGEASHFQGRENSLKDSKQGGVAGKSSERSPGVRSMNVSYKPQWEPSFNSNYKRSNC